MQWRLLKLFPHCWAGQSRGQLTQSQWLWLDCQLALDDGLVLCPACEEPGVGTFCHQCGGRMQQAEQATYRCEKCALSGPGPYCIGCGGMLWNDTIKAIEAGNYDWDVWQDTMQAILKKAPPLEAPDTHHR